MSRFDLTPRLKHIEFFQALADIPYETSRYEAVRAGLLTLRFVDHWIRVGAIMTEPDSASLHTLRNAINGLAPTDRLHGSLAAILEIVQTLRAVDVHPVLPKLFAYAMLLEERGDLALAADVYESVSGLAHEGYDADIMIESLIRAGFCRRTLAAFPEAEATYDLAIRLAKRHRTIPLWFRARIGLAKVALLRGNLPKADDMLNAVCAESKAAECDAEHALALHSSAWVAWQMGQLERAACLAFDAYERQEVPGECERILSDLGAIFILLEHYSAARDTLTILDAIGTNEPIRWNARTNMVALAARSGDRDLFHTSRARLEGIALPPDTAANFLIESARGFRRFGEPEMAYRLLLQARSLAEKHGLSRSIFEVEAMLEAPTPELPRRTPAIAEATAEVARKLNQRATALVGQT